MPETVRLLDYFYTCVDDKPGEGYRLMARMKRREVNFLACSAFPSGPGQVQINFIPESNEALQKIAAELQIELMGPKKAFLLQGEDRMGAIADVFHKFVEADINIHAANCIAGNRGDYGMVIWVSPLDYGAAAKALGVDYKPETSHEY